MTHDSRRCVEVDSLGFAFRSAETDGEPFTTAAGAMGSPEWSEPLSDELGPSLGPCRWFALCENEATRLVPLPWAPDGTPTCERCYERSRS